MPRKTACFHCKRFVAAWLLIFALDQSIAWGGVHFGIEGMYSKNHLGLQEVQEVSGKGSVAVDIARFFRVGYSFRQKTEERSGYTLLDEEYVTFEQNTLQTTHAGDFFAILYEGDIFIPFIFVGLALKSYEIETSIDDQEMDRQSDGPSPAPNWGCGFAITLTRAFSLKVTSTWSYGYTVEPGEEEAKRVRDVLIDLGITYSIN